MRQLAALLVLLGVAGCDSYAVDADELGLLVVTFEGADAVVVETLDDLPCANYVLDLDADVDERRTRIRVRGVEETETCATALGPASGTVAIPESFDSQGYEIELVKAGEVDRYVYRCSFVGCEFLSVGRTTFSMAGPRGFATE